MAAIAPQADAFVVAVAPFEAGEPYSAEDLDAKYVAMVNALVDRFKADGKQVYFTYQPEGGVAADYNGEPLPAAYRLLDPGDKREGVTDVPLDGFDFAALAGDPAEVAGARGGGQPGAPIDRNVVMLREFYAQVLGARAQMLQQVGRGDEASAAASQAEELLRGE
jgi:hypothetical protein